MGSEEQERSTEEERTPLTDQGISGKGRAHDKSRAGDLLRHLGRDYDVFQLTGNPTSASRMRRRYDIFQPV